MFSRAVSLSFHRRLKNLKLELFGIAAAVEFVALIVSKRLARVLFGLHHRKEFAMVKHTPGMFLDAYARKYGRSEYANFAVACYNTNSIKELRDAVTATPDESDMAEWEIGPDEWRDGILAALNAKAEGTTR